MAAIFRARLAGLLLALCALPGGVARGQGIADVKDSIREAKTQAVEITADVLEYDAARKVYVARGNVFVEQGTRTLAADWMAFNPETGIGVASGDVRLAEGGDTLEAGFVQFDIDTLQGIIRDGRLDSPGSQFKTSGHEIEKTGERTYRFVRGTFTTCRCEDEHGPEPWRIRAEEAELEVDGYGTVRDARFEVLGVPVLWLPWMIYPIKTERQTGFLFPEIALGSKNGFGIGLPFFWAVRDEVNLTLTPGWTSKRGFGADADLEYVFGQESWGEVKGAFIDDQDIDSNSNGEPYDQERWAATGQKGWELPGSLRFQSEFLFASDNDVSLDMNILSDYRANRYLESSAWVGRGVGATDRFGGVVSAAFADDLQNPDDIDRDDFLLQRVPHVQAAALVGAVPGVPWLRPSLDVDYTVFKATDRARDGVGGFVDTGVDGVPNEDERASGPGPPDDPHDDNAVNGGTEGDGRFQEGEPLTDDGQRLILSPRVAVPFQLGDVAEVYPEAGWQQTFYGTHEDSSASRGLFTGRVDLRSRLRGRFGEDWVHVVEPLLGYAYVSTTSQSGNPLLVPRTAVPQERLRVLDLDSVTRDTSDRIRRANRMTFGVAQRAWGAGEGPDGEGLRADLTLLGAYEFEEHEFGQIVADGRIVPPGLGRFRLSAGFDPEDTEIDDVLTQWRWSHDAGHQFQFGYRYLRHIPDFFEDFGSGDRFDNVKKENRVNQIDAGFRVSLTAQWSVAYRTAYSFERDLSLANEGFFEYVSKCGCWAAGLELSEDRTRGVEVKVLYRLIGLGRDAEPPRSGLLDGLGGV